MVPLYQAKAEFFRTLGHPARIRILELLSDGELAVHDLHDRISLDIAIEASNLSQQLAVLRRAGLVEQHRVGGEVRYAISVAEVHDLLLAGRKILLGMLEDRDRLKDELAAPVSAGGPLRTAPGAGSEA